MNHYEVLGLKEVCHQSEIKKAYRKMVKIYHPDINPNPSAADLMIKVNEAYEVLSDVTTRNLYDLYLKGVPIKTVIQEASPEQRYKAEYIRNRIRKQREQMEYQIRIKQKFYTYFRFVNILFFCAGVLLTIDYYHLSDLEVVQLDSIGLGNYGTNLLIVDGRRFLVDKALYFEYVWRKEDGIIVKYSGIFNSPTRVQVIGDFEDYIIGRTLYSFHNVFSILILVFSAIVIKNNKYSDFRFSAGLVAFISTLYVFLFVWTKMF